MTLSGWSGLNTKVLLSIGSMSQASSAPLPSQTAIFFFNSSVESDFDLTSMINSGQIGEKRFLSSSDNEFHFSLDTHDASGERTERSGKVKPADESKASPVWMRTVQFASCLKTSPL